MYVQCTYRASDFILQRAIIRFSFEESAFNLRRGKKGMKREEIKEEGNKMGEQKK